MNMIKISNLEFGYTRHAVLEGIDMQLDEGCIYGLLGENGVGKTTLLKLISGLLKADSGEIEIGGLSPFSHSPLFLRNIYYVPEDFAAPEIPVEVFAKDYGVFYPHFDLSYFYELMRLFGVSPSSKFNRLSYGQQKKSVIAFALSLRTGVLLLDEPSNGLDIPSKSQLRRAISESSGPDRTIVVSTHQVRDLENLFDPVIILDNKGVLLNASVGEISEKLYFSVEKAMRPDALYCEPAVGGYSQVSVNTDNSESAVDIEMLFNAVLANRDRIKSIFNR